MINGNIKISGVITFWTLSEYSSAKRLDTGLKLAGLDRFAPPPMSPAAALRVALSDCFATPTTLVRPLQERNAFAVVEEQRGNIGNIYNQSLMAKINPETMKIQFAPFDERSMKVVMAFNERKGHLPCSHVSSAMTRILAHLGGTTLRESGGVYWLPESRLDTWRNVVAVVEGAAVRNQSRVYLIKHAMDEDAVRAVRDAIANEILAEAKALDLELQTEELGEKALENRKALCGSLHKKIRLYENILGQGLEHLGEAVQNVEDAIGRVALQEMVAQVGA